MPRVPALWSSLGVLQKALGSCHRLALVAVTIVTFLCMWRQVAETVHTQSLTCFTFKTPGAPADRSESGRCCTEKPALFTCSLCWVRLGCGLLYNAHLLFLFRNIRIFCLNSRDWCIKLVTERVEVPFSIVSFPLSLLFLFSPSPIVHLLSFPWVSSHDMCESTTNSWIPFLSMLRDGSASYIWNE